MKLKTTNTKVRRGRIVLKGLATMGVVVLLGVRTIYSQQNPDVGKQKPNILFIMVDDLKPSLGCYGEKQVVSPNIDRLASRGMVFTRAYCQESVCMSSRASLLTGCRPDTEQIWTNQDVRDRLSNLVCLPELFKENGYYTVGVGKMYHWDIARSWSEPHWEPENMRYEYLTKDGRALVKKIQQDASEAGQTDPFEGIPDVLRRGMPYESLDVEDNELGDGQIADRAVATLNRIKDRPFFLGVGFLRPHLPFVAPKKYWELYDPEGLQLASNPFEPAGVPPIAMHNSQTEDSLELRGQYRFVPQKGILGATLSRDLIHGYYASVSYVDTQIGRVLDELERLGLAENTMVVLCGDHGWHLGDHGLWCKHTNFESAVRSPLIISVPGMKAKGEETSSLVEYVGIYPTLCDLAGLPLPDHLEGSSFAPLLDQPRLELRKAAFSQYPRGDSGGTIMGYSMRTDRYRYTEWRRLRNSELCERELYDHRKDPQENVNAVCLPEYARAVKELAGMLEDAVNHGKFK